MKVCGKNVVFEMKFYHIEKENSPKNWIARTTTIKNMFNHSG